MSDIWDAWDPDKAPAAGQSEPPPTGSTPPPGPDWPWEEFSASGAAAEVPPPQSAEPPPPSAPPPYDALPYSEAPAPQPMPGPVPQPVGGVAPAPQPVATPSLAEGASFGRYLLREYLGCGWQGETWIAEDTFVGCYVSLKLANRTMDADAFLHAARFGVQLDDLSGVAMHDLGVVDGRPFLARTLVTDGLVEWLEDNGPLPVARAISLAGNLASVLDAAHSAGIVHGNVKPANVLFEVADDNNEYGYLVDFLPPPASPGEPRRVPSALVADTDCMAPEIADGGPPSAAADQYGLACVIYTMLAGVSPFGPGADAAGNVEVTLPGATPKLITEVRRDVPTAAAEVIARALAPHPSARYSSCAEFVETLYRALGSPSQEPAFGAVRAALPDEVPGGPIGWGDAYDDEDADDPMPWEEDFASPFGAAGAGDGNPPTFGGSADPYTPPAYPQPDPYGAPGVPGGYGGPSPYDAPPAYPQPDAYGDPSPYAAPPAYPQPDPYAAPGMPSPYDAPPGYPQADAYGAPGVPGGYGGPSPYDAPPAYPQPDPYGAPSAHAAPYAPEADPHATYGATPGSAHDPWGAPGVAAASGAVVMGEHDFEEHDGGHNDDWDDAGGYQTRARESRVTGIVIGVFVAVVLIVALFIVIRLFTGGSSSSAPDTTQSSTVATAVPNTAVPAGLTPEEASLAGLVSPTFRSTCTGAPGAVAGATAAIMCTPSSGAAKVTYAVFPDRAGVDAAYDKALGQFSTTRSSGTSAPAVPCANQRVEEAPWSYSTDPNQPAEGRYLCGPLNKIATMTWTAWSSNVLAMAERTDLDLKTLGDWWWKNGGPYPPQ